MVGAIAACGCEGSALVGYSGPVPKGSSDKSGLPLQSLLLLCFLQKEIALFRSRERGWLNSNCMVIT
jgi:hypothetical protein